MKKALSVFAVILTGAALFAVSYVNNTYQKLANEYARKAQSALNAGEYELSEQYALKAEENAALSKAYIDMMLVKTDADKNMSLAQKKIEWAKSIYVDKNSQWLIHLQKLQWKMPDGNTKTKTLNLLQRMLSRFWTFWQMYMKLLRCHNIMLFAHGSRQKTVIGTFLVALTFTTTLVFGKIYTRKTRIPCPSQMILT